MQKLKIKLKVKEKTYNMYKGINGLNKGFHLEY